MPSSENTIDPQDVNDQNPEPEEEKTFGANFLDHLEELRWIILKSLAGMLVSIGISVYFIDFIMNDILLKPLTKFDPPVHLINLQPFGQIVLYMEVAFFAGIILGLPWLLYQLWKFVSPALYKTEIKYVKSIVFFSTFCFFLGVAFAYFVIIPYSLGFFLTFGSPLIINQISAEEYMSFIVQVILAAGIMFELPMVSYFLSRLGLLTPAFMRHYRRIAYFVVIVVAGVITPPDVISQMLLFFPVVILYEISIIISSRVQKNKEKKEAQNHQKQ